MISIIYSTRKHDQNFIDHLRNTCGLKNIQIITYINNGEYSLTEIYNKGLKESTNDIVVFCHDDIVFTKPKWGKKLISHFNNTDYGILGVAGTTELSSNGTWWQDKEGKHLAKVVGVVTHSSGGKTWVSKYSGNYTDDIIETLNLDGLFFVAHKQRIKANFNENIKGFHFYDLDFTFNNHLNGVKIGVIYDIKITHKSPGPTSEEWDKNRKQFIEIYKDNLPKTLPINIIYENKPKNIKKQPKLAIIIPTKDNLDLLFGCLNSILDKTLYHNYKIYIGDTGSNLLNKEKIKEFISDKDNIILCEFDYYNFGQINNEVVNKYIDGDSELLLFCNNDIELINDTISEVVDVYNKNKHVVGTVGARLHFEDNTLQHYGMFMYIFENWIIDNQLTRIGVSHAHLRAAYQYEKIGYSNVIGNTGAFLLISKLLFNKVGGFSPNYIECFEDVELNLRLICLNKTNILCRGAVAYHYESKTRDNDENKLKKLQEDYKERLFPFVIKNINKLKKYIKYIPQNENRSKLQHI
jgi:GT2 family glycosyltransferase